MAKRRPATRVDLQRSGKPSRSGVLGYKHVFATIAQALPISEALVVTTLPRGSLQIAQPPSLPAPLLKAYARGLHAEDRLTWFSILRGRAVSGEECFGHERFETSRYAQELLKPIGLSFGAAAPLASPVLEGYPGALHVYRSVEQGPFSASELDQLSALATHLNELIDKVRRARGPACSSSTRLTAKPSGRQFVVDQNLKEVATEMSATALDATVRSQLVEHARRRLQGRGQADADIDRLQVPDSRGDVWNFSVVSYPAYPALGEGPCVIFSLQPDCCEWGVLRTHDFQADVEVYRLIPALKFMQAEFRRVPTLNEIAATVNLSPFHFHRRFAQLLGITPKHFLLECQIFEAKTQLLARKKSLPQIASDCGFAHQSHFTSRFKQATGLTPTRWRALAAEPAKTESN